MLTEQGANQIADLMVAEFGMTETQARAAIEEAWMSLASGDAEIDVSMVTFDRIGDGLAVYEDDAMIAVLVLAAGVLPPRAVQAFDPADTLDPYGDADDFMFGHEVHDPFAPRIAPMPAH